MFLKIFYSIIFGAVQGLTEFLPVSSSGHLVIFHQVFDLVSINSLAFDVALHLGTLLALLLFFRCRLYQLFHWLVNTRESKTDKQNLKLLFFILVATIPAAIAGLLLEEVIEFYFRNMITVSWALIIGGLFLVAVDKYSSKQRDIYSLSSVEIFLIGFAQAFALIPSVSRSAITIIAGLGLKLQRQAAAEFSFLLAIPVVFAASIKKFFNLDFTALSVSDR